MNSYPDSYPNTDLNMPQPEGPSRRTLIKNMLRVVGGLTVMGLPGCSAGETPSESSAGAENPGISETQSNTGPEEMHFATLPESPDDIPGHIQEVAATLQATA